MQLRRPIATLFTALALFGGGVTMTACEAAGQDQNDGTTDTDSGNSGGSEPSSDDQGNLPDNSDEDEDSDEDTDDPQ